MGLLQQPFICNSGCMSEVSRQEHVSAHMGPRDEGTTTVWGHAHPHGRGRGKQEVELDSAICYHFLHLAYLSPPQLPLVTPVGPRASLTLGGGCSSPREGCKAHGNGWNPSRSYRWWSKWWGTEIASSTDNPLFLYRYHVFRSSWKVLFGGKIIIFLFPISHTDFSKESHSNMFLRWAN